VVEVSGKTATHDVHMFGANPSWAQKLSVWGEAGVVAKGKNSKTGNKGATMMIVGYANCESDSVRMWDSVTAWVIVTHDVVWLKKMFFKSDSPDLIELDTLVDLENNETPTEANNQPEKLGGSVTWHSSVAPLQELKCVTCSGHIIKTPDRLTYVPAVELRYLGEMVELDHMELA
jgi:hypothetical protein